MTWADSWTVPKRLEDSPAEQRELIEMLNQAAADRYRRDVDAGAGAGRSVIVVGLPRSGTTGLSQVLARHFLVSYVSNVAALFWRTPSVGLRTAAMVHGPDQMPPSTESEGGRTRAGDDVHEFGYFWSSIFGLRTMHESSRVHDPDLQRLARAVDAMTHAVGRPVLMKSFHAALSLAETVTALPASLFVLTERDVAECANSLVQLKQRTGQDRLGLYTADTPEDADEPTQLGALRDRLDAGLAALEATSHSGRLVRVRHEDLRADPAAVAEAVYQFSQGCLPGLLTRR